MNIKLSTKKKKKINKYQISQRQLVRRFERLFQINEKFWNECKIDITF
jgi:hypothetical protein